MRRRRACRSASGAFGHWQSNPHKLMSDDDRQGTSETSAPNEISPPEISPAIQGDTK